MNRKDEIKGSIEYLNHLIDISIKENLNQEQITNINLAALTHQMADISVTLAIIADNLEGRKESLVDTYKKYKKRMENIEEESEVK